MGVLTARANDVRGSPVGQHGLRRTKTDFAVEPIKGSSSGGGMGGNLSAWEGTLAFTVAEA